MAFSSKRAQPAGIREVGFFGLSMSYGKGEDELGRRDQEGLHLDTKVALERFSGEKGRAGRDSFNLKAGAFVR